MNGAGGVLCFGEMLLRLSPLTGELLLQSAGLAAHFGGAETNVAVSLSRLGEPAALATILPDNAIGRAARDELRRHGVDLGPVVFAPGRMGLYFMTPGAVRRPSEVLYDRAGSAFVENAARAFDWDALTAGRDWLHVSGVTPATGPNGSAAAVVAIEAAVRNGVKVSFDGNFRGKLWAGWDGDPPGVLGRMLAGAELAFADERDFALILGRSFDHPDPAERRRQAALAAFDAFPRLQRIACTQRDQTSVADQSLSAVMLARDAGGLIEIATEPVQMAGVIDRVGGGDAFAAGLLFGLQRGWAEARTLEFALAATVLKHSLSGDLNTFSAEDVEAARATGALDIRR